MDEIKPSAPVTPADPPVMDVKPPAPLPASLLGPENDTISPEVPATPLAPVPPSLDDSAPNEATATNKTDHADEHDHPGKAKKSNKLTSVILIVGVAAVLIVLALYFYAKNKPKTNTASKLPASTQNQPAVSPATANDVNQTIQSIDSNNQKANNNQGVSSGDLTDGSLGL